MKFTIEIEFDQILEIVKQLPDDKKLLVLHELSFSRSSEQENSENEGQL